ncbi:MAG: extracellular solute-binding protein, partial [Pseudomonadota bacterium]
LFDCCLKSCDRDFGIGWRVQRERKQVFLAPGRVRDRLGFCKRAEQVVGNFARAPQGGDTDQLRGIASGECDIAMSNTYYFARAVRKEVSGLDAEARAGIGWVFPNQDDIGAHMNISGGGVAANAPNKENAMKFLEYLASEQAQQHFSAGNDEYPAVPGVGLAPSVASLGFFRPDAIDLADISDNIDAANTILTNAGWE